MKLLKNTFFIITWLITKSCIFIPTFSRLWTKIGGKCMALITEYITHVGEYQYTGRLIDEMMPVGLDKSDNTE